MSAPKVHIGRTYGHQGLRTARTLHAAFGPYARLHVESKRAAQLDTIVGVTCGAIVAGLLVAVFFNVI